VAGSRGYRTYRGKSSRKKAVLAVLLLLVILAAIVVSLLQEHIVYDATGAPHLETPWREELPQEPEEPVDLDLVIQPAEAEQLRGITLPAGAVTQETWASVLSEYPDSNAVAVILKDASGTVYFDSQIAPYQAVELTADDAGIKALTAPENRLHTVAQLACFHDPKAANGNAEGMGLMNVEGFIFYDGNNSQWLDPAKPAAREYLCQLAAEAAELGFCEILLTDVGYPTEGRIDRILYGEENPSEYLQIFLREMQAALEPYGTLLSIELPEAVMADGTEDPSGLVLEEIAPLVDRIYADVPAEAAASCAAALEEIREDLGFVSICSGEGGSQSGDYMIR